MKRAMFAIIVAALVIGCQTEVVQPIVASGLAPKPETKVLDFSGTVEVAGEGGTSDYLQVSGQVKYFLTKVEQSSPDQLAKSAVRETFELTIATEADLRAMSSGSDAMLKISGNSLDRIALEENGEFSIIKRYRIDGMGAERYLNLELRVTRIKLIFTQMWISGVE